MNIFIWVLQDLFYGFLFKKKTKLFLQKISLMVELFIFKNKIIITDIVILKT